VEEFRLVDGFEMYSISDHGRVRNEKTGRILRPHYNQNNLPMVTLSQGGKHTRSVPLLVAKAFLPEPQHYSFDTVMHIDFDRDNNIVDNLCWRPRWFVLEYRDQINWPNKGYIVPIIDVDTQVVYENCWEAAITHGLVAMHISIAMSRGERVFPTWQEFAFF
jgi:hypothetical protein